MSAETFDIVVIGAGIAGASVAAELAHNHRVAILEREDYPGYHSTGRSAALFSEIYGNSVVRALSRASRDFFYNPPENFAAHPLVKPRGSLYIARQDQLPQLEAFVQNNDVAGSIEPFTRAEALRACPALRPDYVAAAVYEKDAADVDVNELHQGYLRRFRSAGGKLAVDADVRALCHRANIWNVATSVGDFAAPIVINAAGAWADTIAAKAGAVPLAIKPCRRTAALSELPAALSAETWPMVIDIDETFYMKPDAGLLLVSPADETPVAPCDVQPEEFDIAVAVDRVEQATTLNITRIRRRWAGLRSFAPDRSPVIGFDSDVPGFFWLAGQGGYGIQTAPAASMLAAALVQQKTSSPIGADMIAQLSPARFAPPPQARSRA